MSKRPSLELTFADDAGRRWSLKGRDAWALAELIRVGERGCTPIDHPGPRWSAYVHKLRRAGLEIETLTETHGPPFPGHHARYILKTPLRVLANEAA